MESAAEVERRLPLWVAFSDLFLDTELTESDYKFIAKRVLESGYSPEKWLLFSGWKFSRQFVTT
jgi:hypothetical protein